MKKGLSNKLWGIIAVILVSGLFLLVPSSGAAIKFRFITSIYSDDQGNALEQPEGVACDQKSRLIVADTGKGRLLQYTFKGEAIEPGAVEIKPDQLLYPIKTEINSRGEIYTLDRRQRSIIRLTPAGEFIDYLRPSRLPSPASYVPRSFHIDAKDNIYILDISSSRVLILNPDGEYVSQIKCPEGYGPFSDVTVDFKGTVLLLDGVNGMVFSAANPSVGFSPLTKSLKEYVRFPTSLTTDNRGRIYLVDRNGGRILILGQDGSFLDRQLDMGWKEGRLNYPGQMCINGEGEVFVADTRNSRVQIFKAVE
jgi:hypothetical protein